MTRWTAADVPSLAGANAVVTGANSGLGLQTALAAARDPDVAGRLWERSEALTGVRFDFPAAAHRR